MPDPRVNLKHIAEVAGVSIATVSNALNSTGRISLATRERILGIAQQLGYEPDPVMRALCHYRQKTGKGNPVCPASKSSSNYHHPKRMESCLYSSYYGVATLLK